MPYIPRAVCGNCNREMARSRNGVTLEAIIPKPPGQAEQITVTSYYKIQADEFKCEECGAVVVTGFAQRPLAEHFQAGYPDVKVDRQFTFRG